MVNKCEEENTIIVSQIMLNIKLIAWRINFVHPEDIWAIANIWFSWIFFFLLHFDDWPPRSHHHWISSHGTIPRLRSIQEIYHICQLFCTFIQHNKARRTKEPITVSYFCAKETLSWDNFLPIPSIFSKNVYIKDSPYTFW